MRYLSVNHFRLLRMFSGAACRVIKCRGIRLANTSEELRRPLQCSCLFHKAIAYMSGYEVVGV